MASFKTFAALAFALMSPALISAAGVSPQLPEKVEAFCPNVLQKRLIYQSDIDDMVKKGSWGQNNPPKEKKHWIAFSDRSNNICSSAPGANDSIYSLSFNEQVIIAKIKGDSVLVYSDPKYQAWPAHSDIAVAKGWLPMNNLLLWMSSPLNKNLVHHKVMIAANLDEKDPENIGRSFSNPVTKADSKGLKTDFSIYYIMKTDPETGMNLLATDTRMDENSLNVLFGWVADNSLVKWDHRLCLEPNWEPADVKYFNNPEGKLYPIFPDEVMKEEPIAYYQYGIENGKDKRLSSKYRMNPYMSRFPLIDIIGDGKDSKYEFIVYSSTGHGIDVGRQHSEFDLDEPEYNSISDSFLKSRVGNGIFSALKRSGATIVCIGYAPVYDLGGRNYWKMVSLWSQDEFETLMSLLGNLYNNTNLNGDRKPFVDAVKALARAISPDIPEKDLDKMHFDEVIRLAAGVSESPLAVNQGPTLREIQKPRVVPEKEYQALISTFTNKYEYLLTNVKNKNYIYSYQSSTGQKFYWIPLEDLPFCY